MGHVKYQRQCFYFTNLSLPCTGITFQETSQSEFQKCQIFYLRVYPIRAIQG